MKTKFVTLLLTAIAGVFVANSAMAADGTIDFSGEITANTCTVVVDNSSTGSGTIVLPVVAAAALPMNGSTAGTTAFNIHLSNCSISDAATVTTYFEPGAYVNADGRLSQSTVGGASNVEIQLLNSDQAVMQLHEPAGSQNDTGVAMVLGDTVATLSYYAQYYATGLVTAGPVTSQVSYSIVYD